jgi:hypothetical protein
VTDRGCGSAPDRIVTYSAQGLMGSSNASTVRADQFQGKVEAFNGELPKATSGGQVHRGDGEISGNAGYRALA